jgi:hypothetical protein
MQAELYFCRRTVEVQTQLRWQSNRQKSGGFQNRPRPALWFYFSRESSRWQRKRIHRIHIFRVVCEEAVTKISKVLFAE